MSEKDLPENLDLDQIKITEEHDPIKEVDDEQMYSKFLKQVDSTSDLTLDKIALDYNSIELNWKSSRKSCNCFEPFDFVSSKLNCSRCGEIYCERCVENGKYVSSQVSTKLVFICNTCLKQFEIE